MNIAGDAGHVGFLVAGVQKAGTTALFEYLTALPDLQLPPVKEAHFFDDEDKIDWAAPDYSAYHALFAQDGRLWGEATPIYIYWPNALERIARYNPAMKLILLFRDPIERAWSQWKMEFARGKETEPFDWCIRGGRARMADEMPYPGHHRVFSYVERGFYGKQLARALELFPRSQVLLLASHLLQREPHAVIQTVCRFLGVAEPKHRIRPLIARAAPRIEYPSTLTDRDVSFLQQLYDDDIARFHSLSGRTISLHSDG